MLLVCDLYDDVKKGDSFLLKPTKIAYNKESPQKL